MRPDNRQSHKSDRDNSETRVFMRIVSYNVLNGGEGRADPLAEVIEAQRPDIVALIEADNAGVVDRMARRLHMDCIRGEGDEHAVAILSRWAIVETVNHAALGKEPPCCLEATIADPSGDRWIVGAVHLTSHASEAQEKVREAEIASLLGILEPHRRAGRAHLLCGDFNANSPIQQIEPDRCKESTRQAWRDNGRHIPRRAIQLLLDAGYLDTLHVARGEAASTTATFTTQHPGQRVDYIFTHGVKPSRIATAWVEHDRLAKYASDHYPIGLDIR